MNDSAGKPVPRKGDDRNGSVLMETVLAMPLLLVLLGGVMWLGQLQINRARLTVADRYVAWNVANRHRGVTPDAASVNEVRSALQDGDKPIFTGLLGEDLQLQESRPVDPPRGFWRIAWDREVMRVTAPQIVASLLAADSQMAGLGATPQQVFLASSTPHFVLARSSDNEYTNLYKGSRYGRKDYEADLEIDWQQVSIEPFWPIGLGQQANNNGSPWVPSSAYNPSGNLY